MENISIGVIVLWIGLFGIVDTLINRFCKENYKLLAYIFLTLVITLFLLLNNDKYILVL